MIRLAGILAVLFFAGICHAEEFLGYPLANVRVIDGDTIQADIRLPWDITLRKQMIRAADYDAWEASKRRQSVDVTDEEVEQGKVATEAMERLSRRVRLYAIPAKGQSRDHYGRVLATLHYVGPDGKTISVADMMRRDGHTRK